jgi:hypothetical protein
MIRAGAAALFSAALAAGTAQAAGAATQSWLGTYRLPATAQPVDIAVVVGGDRATVSMGYGHPAHTEVAVSSRGAHVRFALPGLPANVVFDGTVAGSKLAGNVSQGSLHGSFRLVRGSSRVLPLFGLPASHRGCTRRSARGSAAGS